MSNTSKGRGKKGSKFWMQMVVNEPALKKELDQMIGDDLVWLSPLEEDNFSEYELRQQYIYERLDLDKAQMKELFSFWPNRQPQWDGIALGDSGNTLYLFEAKAHHSEMSSRLSAGESSSIKIEKAMREIRDKYFPKGDYDKWINGYYQMGNRLTFLYKLKENLPYINRVVLVFLNFTNDHTYIAETEETFCSRFDKAYTEITGSINKCEDIRILYYDVSNEICDACTRK